MTEREDRQKLFSVMLEDIGKRDGQIQQLREDLANSNETIKAMHELIIMLFDEKFSCRSDKGYPLLQAWIERIQPKQRFQPRITNLIRDIAQEGIA
jgi:hypothetical protein